MAIDTSTGITITWVTSAFSAEYRGTISLTGMERGKIDITNFSSTGFKRYRPSKLSEPFEMECEIAFDPQLGASLKTLQGAAPETIRLTYPIQAGQSVAPKLEFTGFLMNVDHEYPLEELMAATLTIAADGATITWTDGS